MGHAVGNVSTDSRVDNGIVPRRRAFSFACAFVAVLVATIPFLSGFSTTRVFFIRDLSLYFWGRHLWLRRTLLSGEWPLWDPYIGAGQSAVADALHQMFLLPVLAIRLAGSEVLGFNLWVALPFPCAAAGMWLLLARRFSPVAAALGSIAFALSGPVVSTGNFPNMSWAVAAMPWVLWTVDRLLCQPTKRRLVVLAVAVAFQALAGEPVTLFTTTALAGGFAIVVPDGASSNRFASAGWRLMWTVAGVLLGVALAAIQLVPMVQAAVLADRSTAILKDVWSLHPLALLETVALHLFGDYFSVQSLDAVPWIPIVNTGREPFFFSVYYGVPLFALALFGLVNGARGRWGSFWAAAGGMSIVLAFGVHTPVYPFLRDHLPILASFRFPVKYLAGFSLAVAAGAAAGWDSLTLSRLSRDSYSDHNRARVYGIVLALLIGALAGALALAAMMSPDATARRASSFVGALGMRETADAGRFMVTALPRLGTTVAPLAFGTALLLFVASSRRHAASAARAALFLLISGDLLLKASGVNPVLDARYLAEPEWLAQTQTADWRFYVGGKKDGTLDSWDLDSSRAFFNPTGLTGSASRAALGVQTAFYPSAWTRREMLSYDLAILWPKLFGAATERFYESDRFGRDLFLDRTGVRYRVLPDRLAAGHTPLIKVPYFSESFLYDWGTDVDPRARVVETASVMSDPTRQVEALFTAGWDSRETVLIDQEVPPAGVAGVAVEPSVAIVKDRSNEVVIETGVGAKGGYLVLLDSYADDWRVLVDGQAARILRANGLFRAVRLAPGRHVVAFTFRPRAFVVGLAISSIALAVIVGFSLTPLRRKARLALDRKSQPAATLTDAGRTAARDIA